MLVMLGTGFAAIVLAVTGNRMFTEFAGTFRAIADTFAVNHGTDSSCVVASAQMHTVSVGAAEGCDLLWREEYASSPQKVVPSDPELPHQTAQALTEVGQAARSLRAELGFVGDAVHCHGNLMHAAIDLFGHGGLFFGGAGDLRVHRVDGRDQLGHGVQRSPRLVGLGRGAVAGLAGATH